MLELDGLSLADPSSGGIDNAGCKSGCVRLDAFSLADPSFGGIHNLVCKFGCVTIGRIVAR